VDKVPINTEKVPMMDVYSHDWLIDKINNMDQTEKISPNYQNAKSLKPIIRCD